MQSLVVTAEVSIPPRIWVNSQTRIVSAAAALAAKVGSSSRFFGIARLFQSVTAPRGPVISWSFALTGYGAATLVVLLKQSSCYLVLLSALARTSGGVCGN
jgi:hypothetical protein